MKGDPTPLVRRVEPALTATLFRRLKRQVLALGEERLRSTYQTTFWFPLEKPTNLAELAILQLKPHVPQQDVIGVEWWLSRMWTRDVRVDFHQDRDEKLALRTGALRHPLLSSVLFLNAVRGGLLAVTEQPPNEDNPACAPDALDFELIAPKPNRFVWFDGQLTHGVLDADNQLPGPGLRRKGELRLTLIANWWGRAPTAVPRFSEARAYRALAVRTSATSGRIHPR